MSWGKEQARLFRNDLTGHFLRRPNRFLIIAESGGKELACHCPNPGRLTECLFPGTELILERRAGADVGAETGGTGAAGKPKTAWTVAALRHRGNIVPLYASRANLAAEKLILGRIIPGLGEVRREFFVPREGAGASHTGASRAGGSRFDFLCIGSKGLRHLVEVKACSLVEYGAAMFPDAPSARALKHLEELAALSREAYRCHVLFVILHGAPGVFIPNLHTDPAFAAALSRYGKTVALHAALLRCGEDGMAELVDPSLPVDLSHGKLAASDGGNYLVLLELPESRTIGVGALGAVSFEKGWYVYAGSARKNLSARMARHERKRGKRKHWHIDYLCPYAGIIRTLPIMSYRNLECELARDLEKLGGRPVPGFGASDCAAKGSPCPSHLFHFPLAPLENPCFTDLLFRYRHEEFRQGVGSLQIPKPGAPL
jgi:sugar fermentation stimulation protein A